MSSGSSPPVFVAGPGRSCGFSLLELLIAVALLSIIASVVAVSGSKVDAELRLERVAEEVAAAMRFARAEALRVGAYRSVTVQRSNGLVRVAEPIVAGGTLAGETLLTHPLEKRPYEFKLKDLPLATGVAITNAQDPFFYSGIAAPVIWLLFDARGEPMFVQGGTAHRLASGAVTLALAGHVRSVSVSRHGRVSVQ